MFLLLKYLQKREHWVEHQAQPLKTQTAEKSPEALLGESCTGDPYNRRPRLLLAVASGLNPFFYRWGSWPSLSTQTHTWLPHWGLTSKNKFRVLNLRHPSGLILQSLLLLRGEMSPSLTLKPSASHSHCPCRQSPTARASSLTPSFPPGCRNSPQPARAMGPFQLRHSQVPQREKVLPKQKAVHYLKHNSLSNISHGSQEPMTPTDLLL